MFLGSVGRWNWRFCTSFECARCCFGDAGRGPRTGAFGTSPTHSPGRGSVWHAEHAQQPVDGDSSSITWRSELKEGQRVLCWCSCWKIKPHGRWMVAKVTSAEQGSSSVTVETLSGATLVLQRESRDLDVFDPLWGNQSTVFTEHLAPFERLGCDRMAKSVTTEKAAFHCIQSPCAPQAQ